MEHVLGAQAAAKLTHRTTAKRPTLPHADYLPQWEQALSCGLMGGKAYSKRTIDDYLRYALLYFKRRCMVSSEGLEKELGTIPTENFAKREHYYKAVLCLGRFLIREGALGASFEEEIKHLYPKRHKPPKRFTVDEDGLRRLHEACETSQDRLIITLLSSTGLRVSEACALQWADVHLDKGFLLVQCGKGGKARLVGLPQQLLDAFSAFRDASERVDLRGHILLNRLNRPMDTSGLFQRVQRIGIRANVKASPHALRRAFVTINANKGRPLQMLQIACGHSSVKTTMDYCMTSQMEVVDAMRDW